MSPNTVYLVMNIKNLFVPMLVLCSCAQDNQEPKKMHDPVKTATRSPYRIVCQRELRAGDTIVLYPGPETANRLFDSLVVAIDTNGYYVADALMGHKRLWNYINGRITGPQLNGKGVHLLLHYFNGKVGYLFENTSLYIIAREQYHSGFELPGGPNEKKTDDKGCSFRLR